MSEIHQEPPSSPPNGKAAQGSLAAGIGLAWLVMVAGEILVAITGSFLIGAFGGMLLPPLAILVWGIILINQGKSRTGKGMLLGLLSIAAVLLLLVAACFGILSGLDAGDFR